MRRNSNHTIFLVALAEFKEIGEAELSDWKKKKKSQVLTGLESLPGVLYWVN